MQTFQDDIMRNKLLALDIERKLTEQIEKLEVRMRNLEELFLASKAEIEILKKILSEKAGE